MIKNTQDCTITYRKIQKLKLKTSMMINILILYSVT